MVGSRIHWRSSGRFPSLPNINKYRFTARARQRALFEAVVCLCVLLRLTDLGMEKCVAEFRDLLAAHFSVDQIENILRQSEHDVFVFSSLPCQEVAWGSGQFSGMGSLDGIDSGSLVSQSQQRGQLSATRHIVLSFFFRLSGGPHFRLFNQRLALCVCKSWSPRWMMVGHEFFLRCRQESSHWERSILSHFRAALSFIRAFAQSWLFRATAPVW